MKWSIGLATVLFACSQGGITGKPQAQAILDARLDQDLGNACEAPGSTIVLGDFGRGGDPIPATDGSGNGANSIGCTVKDLGNDQFEVAAEIKVEGGSLLYLAGRVPSTYDASLNPYGVAGVRASFSNGAKGADFRTYGQNDGGCMLQYRSESQGAAAGRVWGHITCPRAAPGPLDAGDASKTCTATAQFRFENCGL